MECDPPPFDPTSSPSHRPIARLPSLSASNFDLSLPPVLNHVLITSSSCNSPRARIPTQSVTPSRDKCAPDEFNTILTNNTKCSIHFTDPSCFSFCVFSSLGRSFSAPIARFTTSRALRVQGDATGYNSQVCAILGAQWGDEGKGKLVDILAKK